MIPAVRAVSASARCRRALVTQLPRLAITPAAASAPPGIGVTCQCDRDEADRGQHAHGQNEPKPVVIHRHLRRFPERHRQRLRRSAKFTRKARVDQMQDDSEETSWVELPPAKRDARKFRCVAKGSGPEREPGNGSKHLKQQRLFQKPQRFSVIRIAAMHCAKRREIVLRHRVAACDVPLPRRARDGQGKRHAK